MSWRDFVQQPNPIASALMVKMQIEPQERARVKLECLRMLATLRLDPARSELIGGFMETYLALNAVEVAQYEEEFEALPRTEKEEVMEIMTSWKREGLERGLEQGLEQGLERGLEQGRREEARALVLRLLRLRVGALPPSIETRVRELPTDVLEDLSEALLEFSEVAEVEAWLTPRAPDNVR